MKSSSLLVGVLALGALSFTLANLEPSVSQNLTASDLDQYEPVAPARGAVLVDEVNSPNVSYTRTRGYAAYESFERKVTVTWRRSAAEHPTSSFALRSDVIATRFHPTAVAAINAHELLVAGVTVDDGRVIIERWAFDYPTFVLGQDQYGMPAHSFSGGGRTSVDIVYNQPKTPSGRVSFMWNNKPLGGNSAFVMLDGVGEIFNLDLSTSSWTLVASSSVSAGGLGAVSELQNDWMHVGEYNEPAAGLMYTLYRDPEVSAEELVAAGVHQIYWIALFDQNEDGVIEAVTPLTGVLAAGYEQF